jgi:hypothetical protein
VRSLPQKRKRKRNIKTGEIMKHGRIPLPPEVKRTLPITVWVNKEEMETIDNLCDITKMPRGRLFRAVLLGKSTSINRPTVREGDVKLLNELSRIGNNINQIAKRLNIGKIPMLSHVQKQLEEVQNLLMEIKNESKSN